MKCLHFKNPFIILIGFLSSKISLKMLPKFSIKKNSQLFLRGLSEKNFFSRSYIKDLLIKN